MTATYIGNGASIPDIPARDLTAEECAKLTAEQKQAMQAQGLYEFQDSEE